MTELSPAILRFRTSQDPDLTSMDFWLWRYQKSKVYTFNPQTTSDLKDAIRRQIQQIPLAIVRASMLIIICRKQSIIVCDGEHEENVLLSVAS